MAKVISVGGLATAGALVAAGAAVNRLFRPFHATLPRAKTVVEPLVLSFPMSPRTSLDGPAGEPVRGDGETVPVSRPISATRSARPGPALLTRRGSRKAWRCV
jgi:hypothetical protein